MKMVRYIKCMALLALLPFSVKAQTIGSFTNLTSATIANLVSNDLFVLERTSPYTNYNVSYGQMSNQLFNAFLQYNNGNATNFWGLLNNTNFPNPATFGTLNATSANLTNVVGNGSGLTNASGYAFTTTNDSRPLTLTGSTNNLGGDVGATHFYGTFSGSSGTNTGLLSAHATATDSNGKFVAAALIESDVASLVVDLSQRVLTNETRNLVFTSTSNNLGGDVSSTHFYGTYSGSSGTNTGLLSAHATATDSNGKFIAAALIESDIASLVVDLSQRVLTNESRSLVFTSATNNLGTDVAATHFYGAISSSTITNTGSTSTKFVGTDSNGKQIASTALIGFTGGGNNLSETTIQATANFMPVFGSLSGVTTTEANCSQAIYQTGYFTNLWFNQTFIGTSTNVTVTLMTNGVASNLAATVVGNGATVAAFDATHGVPLGGGSNNVSLKVTATNPSVSAAGRFNWSIMFVTYP